MSNIVEIGGVTTLDIDPDKVLKGAINNLSEVFVIGWDEDENLYLASSTSRSGDLLVLLELAKKDLLGRFDG